MNIILLVHSNPNVKTMFVTYNTISAQQGLITVHTLFLSHYMYHEISHFIWYLANFSTRKLVVPCGMLQHVSEALSIILLHILQITVKEIYLS